MTVKKIVDLAMSQNIANLLEEAELLKIGEDVIFMPFHFADGANMLTNTVLDETCNIPELKVCAVEISKQ